MTASSPHSEFQAAIQVLLDAYDHGHPDALAKCPWAFEVLDGLIEQKETLLAAVAEYVRVVKEHADALADYAEDMDGDAEQIVSSLGFIGNLDRGCLDPEEDSLAQALDVLRDSFPSSEPAPLQRAYGGKVRTVSTDPSTPATRPE